MMLVAAAVVVGALALQVTFDYSGPEALEVVELLNVVMGLLGGSLFCLVGMLHGAQQQAPANDRLPHEALLALPGIAVASAAFFGAAFGIALVRTLVSNVETTVVTLIFAGFCVLATRLVMHTAADLYRAAHEQARDAEQARSAAAVAELTALRAQLNPHFLFNTLNAVAAFVRHDPAEAERTVENLSRLLRRTLERSEQESTSLREEVDYVKAYLAIEAQRLGDRLAVDWQLQNDTLDLPVPTMLLQPLLENAIKHGIASRLEGGRISIGARLSDHNLVVSVADDGPGFGRRSSNGLGLSNLRRRLQATYGAAANLDVSNGASGAIVTVTLPTAA